MIVEQAEPVRLTLDELKAGEVYTNFIRYGNRPFFAVATKNTEMVADLVNLHTGERLSIAEIPDTGWTHHPEAKVVM